MKYQRLIWADYLKGWLIIMVIIYLCIAGVLEEYDGI